MNGKLLGKKQVCLGPFISHSKDGLESLMNLNPLDLNPAHNIIPVQIMHYGTIHEVVSRSNSSYSSSNVRI